MEKYLNLSKYRKQLEYIDKVWNILQDDDDGNLYNELSEEDEEKFENFMDFLINIEIKTENKLKIMEVK